MIHPLLKKGRFLFVVDGCEQCAIYKTFIDYFNMELKMEKQIEVIDCTAYYSFGVEVDRRFFLFKKDINGMFPMMFIEGEFKYGASTVEQARDWLKARCNGDFLFVQNNPNLHNKDCHYIESGKLKGTVICN